MYFIEFDDLYRIYQDVDCKKFDIIDDLADYILKKIDVDNFKSEIEHIEFTSTNNLSIKYQLHKDMDPDDTIRLSLHEFIKRYNKDNSLCKIIILVLRDYDGFGLVDTDLYSIKLLTSQEYAERLL